LPSLNNKLDTLEHAHIVKNEFDVYTTNQPSVVQEVEKIDTMVISMYQDKAILFATLIPYSIYDFIIPNEFNDIVELKLLGASRVCASIKC
jgi:hypothetical protein